MIHKAIVALLRDHPGVSAMVGDRIAPARLDRDPVLPMITYQQISTPRDVDHGGDQQYADFRVQVNCWADAESDGYDAVKDLAGEVRMALHGFRGTAAGVEVGLMAVSGDRDGDIPERSMDRVTVDVSGNYREAAVV